MTQRTETIDKIIPPGQVFSTAYIMKRLAIMPTLESGLSANQGTPASVSPATLALTEKKLADLQRKVLISNEMNRVISQTTADVKATLAKVEDVRSTRAYYAQYKQKADPLIFEGNQRQQEVDELNKVIRQFIEESKNRLRLLISNPASTKQQIQTELATLEKQRKNLAEQTDKLQVNLRHLRNNLRDQHVQLYTTLPQADRTGLRTPPGLSAPAPEVASPQSLQLPDDYRME